MKTPTDPLAEFRDPGKPHLSASVIPPEQKVVYEPYRLDSQDRRFLEFRLKFPDPAESFSNATLLAVRGEWRMGQAITLEYAKPRIVQVKGRNLTELYRAIVEWRATWLAEFDPEEHLEPTDKSAAFIQSITIHETRPEELPGERPLKH